MGRETRCASLPGGSLRQSTSGVASGSLPTSPPLCALPRQSVRGQAKRDRRFCAGVAVADLPCQRGQRRRLALSQTAAPPLFGGENPIGRFISAGKTFESKAALQVIGVAHDVRFANPRDPFGFVLYVPLTQKPAP